MSDLIRREDALKIALEYTWGGAEVLRKRLRDLPAVQPDAADIRIATLQKAEESLRKWQDNLILCGYKEVSITVGMAADLIATLKGETT